MKLLTPEEVLQAIKDGKKVEYLYGKKDEWYELKEFDFTVENLLDSYYSFRLAQEMITIGDVSFPKPEDKPLEYHNCFYVPDINSPEQPYEYLWCNLPSDYNYLKNNLVHTTSKNAIAHAKALIKLSGGKYE